MYTYMRNAQKADETQHLSLSQPWPALPQTPTPSRQWEQTHVQETRQSNNVAEDSSPSNDGVNMQISTWLAFEVPWGNAKAKKTYFPSPPSAI